MPQRDSSGKFLPGNTICYLGWNSLVTRRFEGDLQIAREYVAQLGRYSYGIQANSVNSTQMMKMRLQTCFYHPGTPESFTELYKNRFEFDLNSVEELPY